MPATPIQSFRGDVVVQTSITDPYAGRPQPLLTRDQGVCVRLEATETVGQWKTWVHRWLLPLPETFQTVVRPFATQVLPQLWVRMGVRAGDRWMWGEWDEHRLVSAMLDPTGASEAKGGAQAIFTTVDPLYSMAAQEEVAPRAGSISQIVQSVASSQFSRFTIEPTIAGRHAYIQAYETAFDFVHRIRGAAVNRDGATDYLLYARGGSLHFHTPGWVGEVKRLAYQNQGVNDAGNLLLTVAPQEHANIPGQGITLVAHDPLQGTSPTYVTQTTNELQLAPELLDFPAAPRTQYLLRHVGQNQLQDLQARTQQRFTSTRMGFFRASFTLTNYPFIGMGDILEFSTLLDPGFNGLWLVGQVSHLLEGPVLKTAVMLWREGFTPASISVATAPIGRRLTLGEIASSARTRPVVGEETLPDGSRVRPVLASG